MVAQSRQQGPEVYEDRPEKSIDAKLEDMEVAREMLLASSNKTDQQAVRMSDAVLEMAEELRRRLGVDEVA